jgi:hypothetical protein
MKRMMFLSKEELDVLEEYKQRQEVERIKRVVNHFRNEKQKESYDQTRRNKTRQNNSRHQSSRDMDTDWQ